MILNIYKIENKVFFILTIKIKLKLDLYFIELNLQFQDPVTNVVYYLKCGVYIEKNDRFGKNNSSDVDTNF